MKRRLVRSVAEVALMVAIYALAFVVVRESRVAEVLMASGGGVFVVAVAAAFVALRLFMILLFPGWVLAIVWWRLISWALWPEQDS